MSRIVDLFEDVCSTHSDRTVVVYREGKQVKRKSFSQLHSDVQRMTAYLADCGVKQGDRILAFAASSYKLCVFMLASLKTGASIMYVDIFAKQESLRTIFSDYKPQLVLVSDRTKYLRPFFGEIGKIRRVINIDRFENFNAESTVQADIPENTTALLTMTTGSTGKPKIAVRSHRDLLQQLQLINKNIRSDGHETVLTTSYIYVFANILNGFTTVMPQLNLGRYSDNKVNKVLRLFADEAVTMIITSPDYCLKAENIFPKLKTLYFGGAILNLHEARLIRKKYPHCHCSIIYGSTECSIIAQTDLDEFIEILGKKHLSVLGRPVDGVRVRLAENGEILVTSEAMLENYLISDSSTKETDADGTLWHHTNDIAEYDSDLLYFLGKSRRYVTVGNKKIYSNCIEQEIIAHFPELAKCAVVEHNGKIHVFLQKGKYKVRTEDIAKLLKNIGTDNAKITAIKKIPCDVKHHTKIDYDKLKGYIR
ncbi:MAG: acyl--CoA ligase [Ruminococcus sp.]|nr:acyl--CoA ligase [Ruminococcus sp.]